MVVIRRLREHRGAGTLGEAACPVQCVGCQADLAVAELGRQTLVSLTTWLVERGSSVAVQAGLGQRGKLAGELLRRGQRLAGGYKAVDQSDPLGLGGVDRACFPPPGIWRNVGLFWRLSGPDLARGPVRASVSA